MSFLYNVYTYYAALHNQLSIYSRPAFANEALLLVINSCKRVSSYFVFTLKKKYLVNQWDTQILLPTTQNKQVAYRTLFANTNTLKIKLLTDSL